MRSSGKLPSRRARAPAFTSSGRPCDQATRDDVGRRLQHEVAQHIGDSIDLIRIFRIGCGILGGEFGDLGLSPAGPGEQIAAIGLRQEIRSAPLDDSQSVGG